MNVKGEIMQGKTLNKEGMWSNVAGVCMCVCNNFLTIGVTFISFLQATPKLSFVFPHANN